MSQVGAGGVLRVLDRLLHRAAVVGIDGPSYRLRPHQRHADTIRAAA
jgi:hypothetical protein